MPALENEEEGLLLASLEQEEVEVQKHDVGENEEGYSWILKTAALSLALPLPWVLKKDGA